MTEIIDFEGKRNQGREKETVEGFDDFDADYAAWEAEYEARSKFVNKLIDKGVKRLKKKCATRFDVVLALIQEQALELFRVSSCGKSKSEIAATIEHTEEIISGLRSRLASEARFPKEKAS